MKPFIFNPAPIPNPLYDVLPLIYLIYIVASIFFWFLILSALEDIKKAMEELTEIMKKALDLEDDGKS